MTDTILDQHRNEFASAVDPKEIAYLETTDFAMENLQQFTDHGLDGLRQLVEVYENRLNDLVLDLVPFLSKYHYEYDKDKHSCIIDKLKANCSNKELVLVASEQLSLCSCPYVYPLLLPLFDLSQPFNASWLSSVLLESVTKAVVCDKCSECPPQVSCYKAVIDVLSSMDVSKCSEDNLTDFQQLLFFIIDTERSLLRGPLDLQLVHQILGKLNMGISWILSKYPSNDGWDPRCVIIASYFPDSVPQVYNFTWLFSSLLPWMVQLVGDVGAFVEGDDVKPVLDITTFFTNKSFTISSSDLEDVRTLFDSLIAIAVNNTNATNRNDASKSIAALSSKFVIQDRLKLIKHYINHENSSVSGLFIDMLKSSLAREGEALSSFQLLKIIIPLLDIGNCDVLQSSHKILAILSLIQLASSSHTLQQKCINLDVQFHEFAKHTENLVRRKQVEVDSEFSSLEGKSSDCDNKFPATISVQGEIITEPTVSEQLQSLQLARCRLDLIKFNLARTRDALDNLSK